MKLVCLGVVVVAAACSTAAPPPTVIPPGVVYTYPTDNQLDVPLGAPVLVTFSDPVNASALAACTGTATQVTGAFCLIGPDGPVAATATVVDAGHTVQLTGAALAPGTMYTLLVRQAVAPAGATLPNRPLVRFTTRSTQARSAPPALIAVNGGPPTAADAFRPLFESSTIQLVFSEPLDPRTTVLASGAFELVDAGGTAVPATLIANGIHVSIDPVTDLTAGAAYQLKVGSQVTDLGGQAMAPVAVALTPVRTGADHPIPQALRTRGSGDPGSALSYAGDHPNIVSIAHPLIGAVSSAVQPSVLAAELGDPLALGGPLAFTIRRGQRLRSDGLDVQLGGELPVGLSTGDITIEVLTDSTGRIFRNPFQPASQRPDNDRSPLVVDLTMDLAISAVDPTGNAALSQTVLGVQGSGVATASNGVLDIQLVIAIDLDLLGVASAPTVLVLELISDLSASPTADLEPPTLVATLPSGSDPLPVDQGVELIFSEPIDLPRARTGIALTTADGQPVASVLESHGAVVVVRPIAPLTYSTSYRVALTDVADVAGNPLAATAPLAFATPTLVATTAPLGVESIQPGVPCALVGATASSPGRCSGGMATDDTYKPFALAADQPVEVTFNQPPLAASITHGDCNAGSVRLEQVDATGACTAPVAGTWLQHDRTLAFVPDAPWQPDQHYRLTMVSGNDRSCAAGELCGVTSVAASFDPLAGNTVNAAGGPDLAIDFVGAPVASGTPVITQTAPFTDVNGSGFVEPGEQPSDGNRVALRITGTTGAINSARFTSADCIPATPETEACLFLAGAIPVELQPISHSCALPDGELPASCVPVTLTPQVMTATSVGLAATVVSGMTTINITTQTGMMVMRLREPATGPAIGYLIDDHGTPTLVLSLDVYLDAPDMTIPLVNHDVHGKPLTVALRGPMRFLPDGRIAIAVSNTADVPLDVNISGTGLAGAVNMVVPQGEMKIQLVSPPLRGGLPGGVR